MKSGKHQKILTIMRLTRLLIHSLAGLFAFFYDAKYKNKMAYWDRFPLVIPFNIEGDSFIGLNLHYASSDDRKKILDFLLKNKMKKSTREYIKISYLAIKSAIKSDIYKPCIHRYLKSHIRSRFVKVNISDWEMVSLLPIAQWQRGKK